MDQKEVNEIAQQLHQSFVELIRSLDETNSIKRRKQIAELGRPWDRLGEAQRQIFLDLTGRAFASQVPPRKAPQPRKQKAGR